MKATHVWVIQLNVNHFLSFRAIHVHSTQIDRKPKKKKAKVSNLKL